MLLERLNVSNELLSKYERIANDTYDENFINREFILKIANDAELCEENKKLISDFLDYANDDIMHFIWLFYYIQFCSCEDFYENIWELDNIPMPEKSERDFPGCIKAVTYLLASENLKKWLNERTLPQEMLKGYYGRYKYIADCNIISHNTYGLCRLSPFLYGYAKPFMFVIERLAFQLIAFKNYSEMYENKNGERLFVALPNYTYNEKGFQDETKDFVPEYKKEGDKLYAHTFRKNGAISLTKDEIDLKEYKLIFKPEDTMFTIHIPESGGKLTKEVVKETLKTAEKILREHFPHFKTFVCQTWFLDPSLRGDVIKDGSNMADFADIFDIICGPDNKNHSVFEHVFKTTRKPLDELIPENSFQERVLERAKKGEKIYWSYGVLKNDYSLE